MRPVFGLAVFFFNFSFFRASCFSCALFGYVVRTGGRLTVSPRPPFVAVHMNQISNAEKKGSILLNTEVSAVCSNIIQCYKGLIDVFKNRDGIYQCIFHVSGSIVCWYSLCSSYRIRAGEVYNKLKDFCLTIKSIRHVYNKCSEFASVTLNRIIHHSHSFKGLKIYNHIYLIAHMLTFKS